ncbi:MAG: hypothetical protein A4E57_00350 [Syntrophorhabdaceae bacterium PtaU1.Bin034]|nr:MAG: hypothetical protein A4E57_00350 [Syntrophorhabdaceae bacterium PtaU1.Bin034]
MDEKTVKEFFRQERLRRASPWKPVSTDHLTTREFLSLVGIESRGSKYRRTLYYLEIAASGDNSHLIPDYLRRCFKEGVVHVQVFHGRAEGPIALEYRIPIETLEDTYVRSAKRLVKFRTDKARDYITPAILRKLSSLSDETDKSIPDIISTLVNREVQIMVARKRNRVVE